MNTEAYTLFETGAYPPSLLVDVYGRIVPILVNGPQIIFWDSPGFDLRKNQGRFVPLHMRGKQVSG